MTRYLIIGDGRASRHIQHYFKSLHIPFTVWKRSAPNEHTLESLVENTDRTLLLLRDDQLEDFLVSRPFLRASRTIHFSGTKQIAGISAAHPLMTFGAEVYNFDTYQNMVFVVEAAGLSFHEMFPELKNPNHVLPADKRALYHAYCVLIGNFTTVLWENAAQSFAKDLQLPKSILLPYLQQTAINSLKSIADGQTALTGPFARGDIRTIIRNIDALGDRPERDLYYAFINYLHASGKKIGDLPNDYLAI